MESDYSEELECYDEGHNEALGYFTNPNYSTGSTNHQQQNNHVQNNDHIKA